MTEKTILITGGCGYIGSHCAFLLLQQDYNIILMDNLCRAIPNVPGTLQQLTGKTPIFYQKDATRIDDLDVIFNNHNIDIVLNLVGYKSVSESVELPLKYYNNNLVSLMNVLFCCIKYNVNNIIFSSSATVYGDSCDVPLTENSFLHTVNPYGRTKLFSEQILQDISLAHNINVMCLRYFNPVGSFLFNDDNGVNLFPVIMDVYRNKKDYLDVFGNDYDTIDGTCVRDYIHILDLCKAHITAITSLDDKKGFHVYNIGTGCGYSVKQVISMFEQVSKQKLAHRYVEKRLGDVAQCYTDCSKAEKELNWRSELTLEDMVNSCFTHNNILDCKQNIS